MVDITIFVEGGNPDEELSSDASTIDNSTVYREGFFTLFSQAIDEAKFNLIVQPIGSITKTRDYLEKILSEKKNGILLIDLDGPESQREERLNSFSPLDTSILFFMIQEMEAWILSQIEVLETYSNIIGLTRKKSELSLTEDLLIKDIQPSDIDHPAEKLNTIFRKYYSIKKIRQGKIKNKPKSYSKTKDGPILIGMIDLKNLSNTFPEVLRLISHLNSQ